MAVDLTSEGAPGEVLRHVQERHGRLDLLVNNAGAGWRARFADGGHANVSRTMELNFDAQVRLTEALLPLLRESAPSAIVNVSSVSGRVGRAGSGAYSASKFALAGWSESLYLEERASGVHVGLVLPGFVATEGFPAEELKARLLTRWIVSQPERVADAIVDAGPGGKPERYVPRAVRPRQPLPRARPASVPAADVGKRSVGDDHAHRGGRGGRARRAGEGDARLRRRPTSHSRPSSPAAPTPAGRSASPAGSAPRPSRVTVSVTSSPGLCSPTRVERLLESSTSWPSTERSTSPARRPASSRRAAVHH